MKYSDKPVACNRFFIFYFFLQLDSSYLSVDSADSIVKPIF